MRTINIIIFFIVFSLIFLLILQQRSQTEDFYFSHKSGFYDNQFFLKIKTGKNYKIFYTLDSSVPTVNSIFFLRLKQEKTIKYFTRLTLLFQLLIQSLIQNQSLLKMHLQIQMYFPPALT